MFNERGGVIKNIFIQYYNPPIFKIIYYALHRACPRAVIVTHCLFVSARGVGLFAAIRHTYGFVFIWRQQAMRGGISAAIPHAGDSERAYKKTP
jgi:hypothetical protein